MPIHEDVTAYNLAQREADRAICDALARWLEKAQAIQWDYKNIVKRRGVLERLR